MRVYVEAQDKEMEFPFSRTVAVLLKQLGINPEVVIVSRNNALVTEEEMLTDTDEVKILNVISGG